MISDAQGFVVEHAQHIDTESPKTSFVYHHIIKEGGIWSTKALFSFCVPSYLLLGNEEKLYESIVPLLPRIEGNKIYFVDCAKNTNYMLEPYVYNLTTKVIQKIDLDQQKGHCFTPMLLMLQQEQL